MREAVRVLSALPLPEATFHALQAVDARVRVHVLSREARRRFRRAAGGDDEGGGRDPRGAGAERGAVRAGIRSLPGCPKNGPVRWIQLASAGADQAISRPLPSGVVLTNAGDLYATPGGGVGVGILADARQTDAVFSGAASGGGVEPQGSTGHAPRIDGSNRRDGGDRGGDGAPVSGIRGTSAGVDTQRARRRARAALRSTLWARSTARDGGTRGLRGAGRCR